MRGVLTDAVDHRRLQTRQFMGSSVQPASPHLEIGGPVLYKPEDNGQRTCRSLWNCAELHLWWT